MAIVERIEHGPVGGVRAGRFTAAFNTTSVCFRLGRTLIDSGAPNQASLLREWFAEHDIHRTLLTHHHEDHSGNAALLSGRGPVLASRLALPLLQSGFPLQPYRRIVWGRPARLKAAPLPDSVELGSGFTLEVHSAQGHSPDMVSFLEPNQGWLFAGDLFVASRPRYLRKDEDLPSQIKTLNRTLRLEFDTLFCGHRGLVRDGHVALARRLDYLTSLSEEAHLLSDQGLGSGEISRRLLGREGWMSWITGFHFSKRNLIEGSLAWQPVDR